MTRAISTTQFMLKRPEAVGASVYTSPTSLLMWSPTARWIEKRGGAETVFICPIA
jgi:hypothetical protein